MQLAQAADHAADADAAAPAQHAVGHLRQLVGQDVQILVEVRGVAQQHGYDLARGEEADAAQVFRGQPVHGGHEGRGRAVGAVLAQEGGDHDGVAGAVALVAQQSALAGVGLRVRVALRVGEVVEHQRHEHGRAQVRAVRARRGLAEHGELRVYLLVDVAQLRAQALHGQGLEHVADDVVLYRLLGVLKVVVAAQEGYVRRGAHLAHLPGELDARDEGHSYVGEQQVRLQLFHELQRVQPVAGAAHELEAVLLPGDHGAHRLAQLVLVVGDYHGVERL